MMKAENARAGNDRASTLMVADADRRPNVSTRMIAKKTPEGTQAI